MTGRAGRAIRTVQRLLAPTLLATSVACGDLQLAPFWSAPRATIQAAASVNAPGFFWLPPIAPRPAAFTGAFDPSRVLAVRIVCAPSAQAVACPEVMRIDGNSAGINKLRVDLTDFSYTAAWRVPETLTLGTGNYLLQVLEGEAVIGEGALHIVATVGEVSSVAASHVAFVRGRTQIIKFRVEQRVHPDQLSGAPTASAVEAIALKESPATGQNFQLGHPDLPGLPHSVNDALVRVSPTATVADVNAALRVVSGTVIGGIPGVPGRTPATLVVRFATTSHAALEATLVTLRAQPGIVDARPDVRLEVDALPQPSSPMPGVDNFTWDWQRLSGGNWGLKTMSVPQMWNFNDWMTVNGTPTDVGVIDAGFTAHEDVLFAENLSAAPPDEHGTMVAGVIGARFGNGTGVDGIDPFTRLGTRASIGSISLIGTTLMRHISTRQNQRVINVSLGYNWYKAAPPIDANASPKAQQRATYDGAIVANGLATLAALGYELPVITASAGNNSNKNGWGFQLSIWSSPLTNAALEHGAAPIIVVEAIDRFDTRASFTNIGGHLSAPGVDILLASGTNTYRTADGTSFAAPHVAGVVSYLYGAFPAMARPTMTTNPVLDLLKRNAVPVEGAPPFVNAFRSALDLDRIRGGETMLEALLDVDDGSLDGNLRVNVNGQTILATDLDGNGRRGDGEIDMSDFRVFRDHLLDFESSLSGFSGVLHFNGPANHPKRDLNGDGVVEAAGQEGRFPRVDFNGDGGLFQGAVAPMSGALDGERLTDLEVLQSIFLDAHYTREELPTLLRSADVTLNLTGCFARTGVTFVGLRARRHGTNTIVHQRTVLANAQVQVLTVPYNLDGVDIDVDLLAVDGTTKIANFEVFAPAELGGDTFVTPPCLTTVSVSPPSTSVNAGGTVQFTATVTGAPTSQVTWSATGGTISATGLFTAGTTAGTFSVTATSVTDPTAAGSASVTVIGVAPPAPTFLFQQVGNSPASPIRYRSLVRNLPGATVQFSVRAISRGISIPPGDVTSALLVTRTGPIAFDATGVDWFVDIAFPTFWGAATEVGVTMTTTACYFRSDGTPVLNLQSQPLCQTIQHFH